MTNITTEIVRELLDYNTDTGIFTWRQRSRDWFQTERSWKIWNTRYAGKMAGSISMVANGYQRIMLSVLGRHYYASRLAFLHVGELLPEQVDHLDQDSLNNRWKNLIPSRSAENQKNMSKYRNNTSSVTGVSWNKGAGKWRAYGRRKGKSRHLGLFDDLDDAAAVVAKFYAANGFSDRHGQELAWYAT